MKSGNYFFEVRMKKSIFILLMPAEIALLFLLSYFTSGLLNDNVVQAHLMPIFGKKFNVEITSLFFNGIVYALFAFILIVFSSIALKIPLREFGFNICSFKLSIMLTLIFLVIFMTLYVFIGTMAARNNLFSYKFPFPLSTGNFIFYSLFELFVSGLEEIFFRGFVISVVLLIWRPIFKNRKSLEMSAIIASTLIFALRHIGMTFLPFKITYLVPLQILVAVVMGLSFGYIFVRSKSLLGGYIAHGISNFLIVVYLLALNFVL